jgi:transposase
LQVSKRYFLILLNLENNDSAIQYTWQLNSLISHLIHFSRDRVTDENAAVRFLAPNHPVLTQIKSLLKILKVGLKNRDYITLTNLTKPSSYFIFKWQGESPTNGALLVAPMEKDIIFTPV